MIIIPLVKPVGWQMINTIRFENFRCYKHLEINDCAAINVIVGDNGSGKTALLEGIFLPLCNGTEVAVRLRQVRGIDGNMNASARRIEDAIWGDFFYKNDMTKSISLSIEGDGQENRSLKISKGAPLTLFPAEENMIDNSVVSSPVTFIWTNSHKEVHTVVPQVTPAGLQLPRTKEDLEFAYFFYSQQTIGSVENAVRFSELSKRNKHKRFVKIFTAEYKNIKDLNVEVHAGMPCIFATLNNNTKIPLPNVSSGINRIASIMLAIASSDGSVVLIDEIENGAYYAHMTSMWKSLISMAREYKSQIFVTTHSQECLLALHHATANNASDIALWRTENVGHEQTVKQFTGSDMMIGIQYGQEVR